MVAIEHCPKSSTTNNISSAKSFRTSSTLQHSQQSLEQEEARGSFNNKKPTITTKFSNKMSQHQNMDTVELEEKQYKLQSAIAKSAVSQRNVDMKISKKSNMDTGTKELTKKVLKLDLTGKELDEYSLKSPKSPITARLTHQTSLTSSVDVEDRKTLREALYQGIFHRHRRTIFAVGSFLRMLRSRNSQYNTIRSSSEGEDVDETR